MDSGSNLVTYQTMLKKNRRMSLNTQENEPCSCLVPYNVVTVVAVIFVLVNIFSFIYHHTFVLSQSNVSSGELCRFLRRTSDEHSRMNGRVL